MELRRSSITFLISFILHFTDVTITWNVSPKIQTNSKISVLGIFPNKPILVCSYLGKFFFLQCFKIKSRLLPWLSLYLNIFQTSVNYVHLTFYVDKKYFILSNFACLCWHNNKCLKEHYMKCKKPYIWDKIQNMLWEIKK